VHDIGEGPSGLLTLPEPAWKLSLGICCAWKGLQAEPGRRAAVDGSIAEPRLTAASPSQPTRLLR
jgi:hypothetical protein